MAFHGSMPPFSTGPEIALLVPKSHNFPSASVSHALFPRNRIGDGCHPIPSPMLLPVYRLPVLKLEKYWTSNTWKVKKKNNKKTQLYTLSSPFIYQITNALVQISSCRYLGTISLLAPQTANSRFCAGLLQLSLIHIKQLPSHLVITLVLHSHL